MKRIEGKERIGLKPYGLTILGPIIAKGHNRRSYSDCMCECGNIVHKRLDTVLSGKIRYCTEKCTRTHNNTLGFGSTNPCYRGIGHVGSTFLNNARHNAKRRNIHFDVTDRKSVV